MNSAEIRFLWGLIPKDCKESLSKLHRLGLMETARAEIIAEAARSIPEPANNMTVFCALEIAAENWLKKHKEVA